MYLLIRFVTVLAIISGVVFVALPSAGRLEMGKPSIEDYATIEAYVGKEETPVYAFGYTYVYGVSPDLLPGAAMQEGNSNPVVKFKPKKSWEIKDNLLGSTPPCGPSTMWNDDQPLLPIHLIDGDPETAWSSRGGNGPDRQPEWIRIDIPMETQVASVVLVCSNLGPGARQQFGDAKPGKALPKELTIKLSKDAWHWETVYENSDLTGNDSGPTVIEFEPRAAKQIWIIGNNFRSVARWGHAFSIGEVEVRDPEGNNLALVSRGAGVQVSTTHYGYGAERFSQAMYWPLQYDLGFKWTRVGYDGGIYLWSYVEREKGKLKIDNRADEVITEAARNGVNVIMGLDKGNWLYHNPPRKVDWKKARVRELMHTYYDHQGWPTDSDEMMQGYLRYVDYMVRHFKGRVAYYEICNEWGGQSLVETAKKAIPVIKKADPSARIMLGSFGGFDLDGILFCLRKEKGLAQQLDAVGWHNMFDMSNPDFTTYKRKIEDFKREAAALGFNGVYAATETYWAAAYPGGPVSEIVKAKGAAREAILHSYMGILSLYNQTYETGKIDWDCTLLRNAFQCDPISPAQPQPLYYVFRSLSTVLDGFQAAELPVKFSGENELDCYTFKRGQNEVMFAVWIPGKISDGIVESRSDVIVPGIAAKRAWVIDIFNGTEQELDITPSGGGTIIKGMSMRDYPVLVRLVK